MRNAFGLPVILVALLLAPAVVTAQERGNVAGVVVDAATQQPLAGALVTIQATAASGLTDERGRFLLANVPRGTHTLRVQFLGYKLVTREVTVGATTEPLTIALETDPLRLDELVVVGYGTERRRAVAGSSRKPGAGWKGAASPSPSGARKRRTTTATSRSRTCRLWRSIGCWSTKSVSDCPSSAWPANAGSLNVTV